MTTMSLWAKHSDNFDHFIEQIEKEHANLELTILVLEAYNNLQNDTCLTADTLISQFDSMNDQDDNSTSFLMRIKESISEEVNQTRRVKSAKLTQLAEKLRKSKEQSQVKLSAILAKYDNCTDKEGMCKELQTMYTEDMKMVSETAGDYLQIHKTYQSEIAAAECYIELSELSECDPSHAVQAALQTLPSNSQSRKMSNRRRSSVIDAKDDLKEQFRRASLIKEIGSRNMLPEITQLHGEDKDLLPQMYVTLGGFDGTKLQEFHALSIGKGEILTELDVNSLEASQVIKGWSKVKNQRGSVGFVPTPLLQNIQKTND